MKHISPPKASHLIKAEVNHLHFSVLDSTNAWAKRNADRLEPAKITMITASQQTEGKGRLKRVWQSPPDCNLYASFCFFVSLKTDVSNIGQVMAVSAVEALKELDFKIDLKWPNDLILQNKKVGGILCETTAIDDLLCVIVGIGLNINMESDELKKIDQPATSLFDSGNRQFNVDEVAVLLKKAFQNNLGIYFKEGFSPFYQTYRDLNASLVGKQIDFQSHNKLWQGGFKSVLEDGSLEIKLPSGESKIFTAGEILKK